MLGRILFAFFLLMTYQNLSKAVAKSLLMIPKYMTWLATVLRYRKTSIDCKNGLTLNLYFNVAKCNCKVMHKGERMKRLIMK